MPSVGRIVHVRYSDRWAPGIITRVHETERDVCDITAFVPWPVVLYGVPPDSSLAPEGAASGNRWRWPIHVP